MKKKQNKNANQQAEQTAQNRETLSSEEALTLGKDVFDLRCFFKKIYNNRAVIGRRLNIISLIYGIISTMFYVAFAVYTGFIDKLSMGWDVTLIVLGSIYGAAVVAFIIVAVAVSRANTKNIAAYNKTLKFVRFSVRILSLGIAIAALVMGLQSGAKSPVVAFFETLTIITSIIGIIFQAIPLIFGGFGRIIRWLLSPVRVKVRFSVVALEWYRLAVNRSESSVTTAKVSQGLIDKIGTCIDATLIPAFGKKYISRVHESDIQAVVRLVPEESKAVTEGVLKNLFAYAKECGYVSYNPCKKLGFTGDINEQKKPKKTIGSTFAGGIKKMGKSIIGSVLKDAAEDE